MAVASTPVGYRSNSAQRLFWVIQQALSACQQDQRPVRMPDCRRRVVSLNPGYFSGSEVRHPGQPAVGAVGFCRRKRIRWFDILGR